MKLSARNRSHGTISDIRRGATATHVRIEAAPGVVFTASTTNEAAEEFGLAVGGNAAAVVTASDVVVGVA